LQRTPLDLTPSMYTLLWDLYKITGDVAFVQVLYHGNDNCVEGLPHDLFAEDPAAFQQAVAKVITREGPILKLGSINKQQWHLAILRSGQGENERAAWLDYDSGGGHGHQDGMNLGLFAKGLDLMPDFGYPPVQYGGWGSAKPRWYKIPAAHNTVVVTGQGQNGAAGATTLWADGGQFQAIRASGRAIIGGRQYERTVAMVDLSESDSYILDVFRVAGGPEHCKFMHSHFGQITTEGLSLQPAADYGYGTQMRNFRTDPAPEPGWSVDWQIEDRYEFLPADSDIHLRYTDLSTGIAASICEGWINAGKYDSTTEAWIPRVMVRRQTSEEQPVSTFVGIIEPYERRSNIAHLRRLPLETRDGQAYPDSNVAVEVELVDGRCDLLIAADAENPLGVAPSASDGRILVQDELGVRLRGELAMARLNTDGDIECIVLCHGKSLTAGDVRVELKDVTDFIEISFDAGKASVVSGNPDDVEEIRIRGRRVLPSG